MTYQNETPRRGLYYDQKPPKWFQEFWHDLLAEFPDKRYQAMANQDAQYWFALRGYPEDRIRAGTRKAIVAPEVRGFPRPSEIIACMPPAIDRFSEDRPGLTLGEIEVSREFLHGLTNLLGQVRDLPKEERRARFAEFQEFTETVLQPAFREAGRRDRASQYRQGRGDEPKSLPAPEDEAPF